jgi:hypothetical protein
MTDSHFMDTALNWQPGIRIAPDAKRWVMTNGIGQLPVCTICAQPIQEGHVDCTCDKNHPENCERETYAELLRAGASDSHDPFTPAERIANARRISGDNADLAIRCSDVLQALLDRHNGGGDPLAITILSPADVTEIKAALDWRVY